MMEEERMKMMMEQETELQAYERELKKDSLLGMESRLRKDNEGEIGQLKQEQEAMLEKLR